MTDMVQDGSRPVYLDYDQQRLDLNYNQTAWAPNAAEIIAWYREASLAAHARLASTSLAYGVSSHERIDLFPTSVSGAPLVAYIHGGAWRLLDRMDSAYAAEAFVAAGINFAVIDFASIPAARLPDMVTQVQRGILHLSRHAEEFGCDPDRLFVIGHSSGAHLVAAALSAATSTSIGPGVVHGALCASGAYDLEGAMLSARGAYLQLTSAEVEAFSPPRHAGRIPCPVTIAYGDGETEEYRRQARAFHESLAAAGRPSELIVAEGQNHFEISRTLTDPDGLLFKTAMRMIAAADRGGK